MKAFWHYCFFKKILAKRFYNTISFRITQNYANKISQINKGQEKSTQPSTTENTATTPMPDMFGDNKFIQTLEPDIQYLSSPEDIALNKFTSSFLGKECHLIDKKSFTKG